MSNQKPWTDYEYEFIQERPDWTAAQIAEELGRSKQSIYTKRWRIANGWRPQQAFWDISEDEIILASGSYATVAGLAEKLPGRTLEAIQTRRIRLGVKTVNSNQKMPTTIGARPLIARSCTVCGLLLAADWFVWLPRQRQWTPNCKKCRSTMGSERKRGRAMSDEGRRSAAAAFNRFQALTIERATRSGDEYTEADHEILKDPDLTCFQKAIRCGRSYAAARGICAKNGYKSHVGLGDPERDQWIIDNPNLASDGTLLVTVAPVPEPAETGPRPLEPMWA